MKYNKQINEQLNKIIKQFRQFDNKNKFSVPDREKIIKKQSISSFQQRKLIPRQEQKRARHPSKKISLQSLTKAAFIVQQENQNIVKIYDSPYVIEDETKINSLDQYNNLKNKSKNSKETREKLMSNFRHLVKKITFIDRYYPQFLMIVLKKFRHDQNYFSQQSQLKQLQIRYDHLKQIQLKQIVFYFILFTHSDKSDIQHYFNTLIFNYKISIYKLHIEYGIQIKQYKYIILIIIQTAVYYLYKEQILKY